MVLPILALVLMLPQVAGYVVTRVWRPAGKAEWLGAAVATYAAIWYATCHSMLRVQQPSAGDWLYPYGAGPQFAWGLLGAGLVLELGFGVLCAGVVFHVRRSRASVSPPAS
jgi:hypothetical protein